jgi:hypothetical protein
MKLSDKQLHIVSRITVYGQKHLKRSYADPNAKTDN